MSDESSEDSIDDNQIISECFISVQKIMRSELKAFDTRDSFVLRNNLSFSRRMSGHSMEFSMHDMSLSMSTLRQRESNAFYDPKIIRDLFL